MCGVAGIISIRPDPSLGEQLDRMIRIQAHRGPDGRGVWTECVGNIQVGLASARLAILDLRDAAGQPMTCEDGRHVLVYNGEVYNYRELRAELQGLGVMFGTSGDTEVVLRALVQWGTAAFEKFNGMWGLAWLDRRTGFLVLSRDRLGVKPLYWHRDGERLLFASEIKGILVGAGKRFAANRTAVARYLMQSQLDAQSQTFFAGIESIPAGHYVQLDLRRADLAVQPHRYWTVPEYPLTDGRPPDIEQIRETFHDAVRIRLRSDVPVGVLLSGGLDSSSIAAGVRRSLGDGVDLRLFSMVSDEPRYSEAPFIERMAAHLGTGTVIGHVRLDAHEAFRALDTVTWHNDEPIGSFSTIAHYLLMRLAKDLGVTVILCGQGGDELLCGYLKYWAFYLQSLARAGRWGAAAQVIASATWRGTVLPYVRLNEGKRYLPAVLRPKGIDLRGPLLQGTDSLLDLGLGDGGLVARQRDDLSRLSLPALLHYEDRMSMALSREIRLPFLDHRVVSLLLPLAPQWKLRDGWSKWVFRKAMEPDLPPEITWRKDKQGFDNPQSQWLRKELRGDVETILGDELLTVRAGLIDAAGLRQRYAAYRRQGPDRGALSFKDIFNPLALEIWARRFEPFLSLES